MAKPPIPKVYVDAVLFFNIIKREAGLWESSLKVLLAAERGDIKLVASTLLLIEADYFMSRDGAFPYGQKISGVEIIEPMVVWQPTLDDHRVDEEALTEEE